MYSIYLESDINELIEKVKETSEIIVDLQIQGMNEEQAQVYLLKEIMYRLDIQKHFIIR